MSLGCHGCGSRSGGNRDSSHAVPTLSAALGVGLERRLALDTDTSAHAGLFGGPLSPNRFGFSRFRPHEPRKEKKVEMLLVTGELGRRTRSNVGLETVLFFPAPPSCRFPGFLV